MHLTSGFFWFKVKDDPIWVEQVEKGGWRLSIYTCRPILAYCVAVAACLGAVMGSFLNCAAFRIVRGESFLKGRSRCPACGHELTARELVPVLSWVFQRGRCRACGAKVSARYPLTELGFALATVLCLLRFDLTVLCLRNYAFLCCLFLLTLTDLEDMTIPDGCHIASALAWLAALPFAFTGWGDVVRSLAAALIFGGGLLGISLVMDKVLGRDSLGGGDIKLFAVVGLYLGIIGTLFTLLIACVLGLMMNAALRRHDGDRVFPFGPAIALSAALMLLYGDPLIQWYRGLLL